MSKLEYTILKPNIQTVKLVGYTSQSWYDTNNNIVPWIGTDENGNAYNLTPSTGLTYYNTSSLLDDGFYKWNGSTWYSVPSGSSQHDYNLPLFLDANLDEMGVMVSFADVNGSGSIQQVDQIVNFLYSQTGNTVQVFSSVNPDKLRTIVDQNYTIDWGDGIKGSFPINKGIVGTTFPSVSHSYTGSTNYNISIYLESPWTTQSVTKVINTANPFTGYTGLNMMGTYTYTGPNLDSYLVSGRTQNYYNDLDNTNNTGYTNFSFALIGGSRIGELRKYGEQTVVGANTGSLDENGHPITGYTIDGMYYMDYIDGHTVITGTTSGYTKEEVFNRMITRNEHFLGFIDDPTVYSDIFVERGKSGVAEFNLRLSEIDNMAEMELYGNGYFTVKKT
jgi:hypothetical protein